MMSSSIFSNKEKTKWKILSFCLIGILIASITATAMLFHIAPEAVTGLLTDQQLANAPSLVNAAYGAGVLTNVFALPADNIFSTKTYYTIAFTTATVGAIREIEMTFPAGFNVATAKLLEVQGIGAGSLSVLGQVVKYTVSSPVSIPAQKAIKLSLADITNSAITSNQVSVTTKAFSGPNIAIVDGPTNSAVFTLIQVSNPMIGANTITAPKLTANSVDSSKISDGSIGKTDVSTGFVKKVSLPASARPGNGWNPDWSKQWFAIVDSQVSTTSLVVTSLGNRGGEVRGSCPVTSVDLGGFAVNCDFYPDPYITLNYVVIN